jgi:glycosyltransferase involved in cell wall biosynthesis
VEQDGALRPDASVLPFFSVVMPTYNRADLLPAAIRSVLDQTFGDLEVVIVDDGSTDGTGEIVASVGDRRVRYIPSAHRGVCAARNRGARAARGRYLLFLDSDDRADPRWLEAIRLEIGEGASELVFCGMEARRPGGDLVWRWVPSRGGGLQPDELIVHFESGGVAYRRDVFAESAGFCEELRFGENTELGVRLLACRRSLSLAFVPEVLVYVRPAGSQTDYASVRPESARYILAHHPGLRQSCPRFFASCHAIVGAAAMRAGDVREARRHFAQALLTDRRVEHLERFLVSLLPAVPGAAWPAYGHPDALDSRSGTRHPEVLFVALASGLGGSMRSLGTVLGHLRGVSRTVACPGPTGFTELIEARGSAECRLAIPGEDRGRLVGRATTAMLLAAYAWRRRETLVAVHANGLSERAVASLAAALAGVPLVVWVHDWEVPAWARRLAPLLALLSPRTRFAAVSVHTREMLLSARLAGTDRISVVPNPIDAGDVLATTRSRGAGTVDVTVGFVGAPARYKGFHLLPSIIREVGSEKVRWVVYSGPRTAMRQVWVELEAQQGPVVRLEDKVVDVREAYRRLDILVCPSERESFGRVVAEAMLNGIPVVASDLPPLRDLLGDDEAGVLFPPGDAAAAAAAIRALAADPSLRQKMGVAGRRRAAVFSPETVARQLASLYGLPA